LYLPSNLQLDTTEDRLYDAEDSVDSA